MNLSRVEAMLYLWCRPHGIPEQPRIKVIPDPSDPTLHAGDLQEWLRRFAPHVRSRLAVIYPTVRPPPPWVDTVLDAHKQRAAIGRLTIMKFAERWALNMLGTLRRRPQWVSTAAEPWRGRPVFVVGAGASLDRNGHLLAEAQKRGPVFALNTSAGCCAHYGVQPDAIYCCEANDFPEHVAAFANNGRTHVILDALASQATWDAAPGAVASMLYEPYLSPYLLQMGVTPLHYSTSSSTAAASLAMLWGASSVVLLGHNHSSDRKVYASGSPFEGHTARNDGELLTYEGGGKDTYQMPVVWREGWAGGDAVPSDHTFSPVIEWYANAGERNIVINASEGGANIANTFCEPLESVLRRYPEMPPAVPQYEPAQNPAPVLESIASQARAVIESGAETCPVHFSLLHMWLPSAMETTTTITARRRAVAEAVQRGAREILQALEG